MTRAIQDFKRAYRHPDWLKFRESVIARDKGKCVRCGKPSAEDSPMHVHHIKYLPGRMPWDYARVYCESLCSGCHAAEHGIIPPKVGWTIFMDEDLEEVAGTCELCGTAIRYVFHVHHSQWEPMAVGADCCDNLTSSRLASTTKESIERFERRRAAFVSSKRWKPYSFGARITQKGMKVDIFKTEEKYRIIIDRLPGSLTYPTMTSAKIKVFELLEDETLRQKIARMAAVRKTEVGALRRRSFL